VRVLQAITRAPYGMARALCIAFVRCRSLICLHVSIAANATTRARRQLASATGLSA
jgi:hypothetical protein